MVVAFTVEEIVAFIVVVTLVSVKFLKITSLFYNCFACLVCTFEVHMPSSLELIVKAVNHSISN